MPNQPLQLPGTLHVAPTADELYDQLGMAVLTAAKQAVAQRGVFHLALSGGSTPEPFYQRLVIDPRFREIPWRQSHVWQVDERRVPPDDDKSNFKMIRETLLRHVTISRRQIHPMDVLASDPATEYENALRTSFELRISSSELKDMPGEPLATSNSQLTTIPPTPPSLDFILLGMGDDGHTASLFPGSPALDETHRWIAVNDGPNVTPPPRVTMTYPLLNAGRTVAVLLTGAKKHATLSRISETLQKTGPQPKLFPITGIAPSNGQLTWYMDAAAAGVD